MEMRYASFWTRFLAALLDGIILYILGTVIGFAVGVVFAASTGGKSQGVESLGFVVGILIGWLYHALTESSAKQATLGKQALGIIVTDLNGARISFGKATARYFSKWISSITFLIGYIMAAFTEKHQALHDMIAGTLVIKQ